MTFKSLVVTLVLAASWPCSAQSRAPRRGTAGSPSRLEYLQRWLTAALTHDPGGVDDPAIAVGEWTGTELRDVFVDVTAVTRLVRNPRQASAAASFFFSVPVEGSRAPIPVQYSSEQVTRLKELACVVGGLLDTAPCEWVKSLVDADAVLSPLSAAAARVSTGDANFFLRRGALLHTDIAILGLAAPREVDRSSGSIRMSIADGHQTTLTEPTLHWEIARKLLDQITAPGSTRLAPAGDAMVRQWYVATATWMQQKGHHDNAHLDRGREIFPDDADLSLLAGAQHEAYATSAIQTAVRSAFLPTGVRLAVESERNELRDAERFLRRATGLKPQFAEAHIRLGRVLALMGRDADAAASLTQGLNAADEPLLQYYASLFLGAVEEKLGHADAAKSAYERAAGLFPMAQSPHFGLSELARRAGRRDEALREMAKVYTQQQSHTADSDPWWTYNYAQGRHADRLLDVMRNPFHLSDEQ